jgi:hypothetical protein
MHKARRSGLAERGGEGHVAGMERLFWTIITLATPGILFVVGQGLIRINETGGSLWMAVGSVSVAAAAVAFGFLLDSRQPPQ